MTRIIAHRGARSLAPENTLAAAQKGFEAGAWAWETDVTITRDRQLVLFHDPTLERTTNVRTVFPKRTSCRISHFNAREILGLDAGSYFIKTDPFGQIRQGSVRPEEFADFGSARVPTVAQGLAMTRQAGWRINLELKRWDEGTILQDHPDGSVEDLIPSLVLETIERSGIDPASVMISSFYHPWLLEIEQAAPHMAVQALMEEMTVLEKCLADDHFQTFNVSLDLARPDLIQKLKARRKQINIWTVNDEADVRRLIQAGVDGIITDFPQQFATQNAW